MFPEFITIFTLIFIFNLPYTFSLPFIPATNITFFGDAHLIIHPETNLSSISLTQQNPSSSGRAFYFYPLQFLDPETNSSVSFTSHFSFSITPSSPSNPGDGIAFLITSDLGLFSSRFTHLGMPEFSLNSQESFFAVEFDTKFDPLTGDVNDNHVGIDVNSYISLVSDDGLLGEVDLSSGKKINAWIEYRKSVKIVRVWVSYFPNKPLNPVVSAQIDLSKYMKESMYVGFSASNRDGSALHVIDGWEFKTFEFDYSTVDKDLEGGDCMNCIPGEGSDGDSKKDDKTVDIALTVVISALSLFAIVVMFYLIWMSRKDVESKREKSRRIELKTGPIKLHLSEIESATNGFSKSKIIGQGASSTVYRGILFHGQVVAVKRLNDVGNGNNLIKPFTNECTGMARKLKHKNLVQLLGWCCEKNELILVYEFLPNGNLDQNLHRDSDAFRVLTCEQRLNIVLGIASGLTYLHEECSRQIIHRDVKTCNVMLDSDFNPKLGDFGLVKVYDRDSRTRKPTIPAGTMGYLAPEYVYSGIPTIKSDVYSFGVVVLEVVSGRRPVEEKGGFLIDWVWNLWEEGKVIEAIDWRMMGMYSKEDMERMLKVGLWCVHSDKKKRPTIKKAAMMLRGDLQVPDLPAKRPDLKLRNAAGDDLELEDCPWATPKTHFSEH
ncbi:hypothetical protein SOVF_090070 [Spinacia oleracea]|nr:hypothetical protein SOVF_090070 [Spinacia oleracea]